ncbi:MAG: DUF3078 domain-containing protein [Bacteroidales bacterium]|nr:DUF3078 domain-containing protein [Bacteroidales bacterium]
MKKIVLIFSVVLITGILHAQDADTAWKVNGDFSVLFSQSSFTNWAPGGENSVNINSLFNFYVGYEKGKSKWENFLNLAYGQNKTGELGWRKGEDKIDFQSTYGLKAADKWYYTANLNFKSQFAEGFDYHDDDPNIGKEKISNFMAPGYISAGLGMEYKPVEYMSFYLAPVTARWIIVNDQELANAGAFGVEKAEYDQFDSTVVLAEGENVRQEFGAYFRFLFVKDIMKNVNYNTKLELFSDYTREPGNIDVNWDNTITMTVNKWINANFSFQVVYDHDTPILDKDGKTGPRTQFKEVLSVGLAYKFANR